MALPGSGPLLVAGRRVEAIPAVVDALERYERKEVSCPPPLAPARSSRS
jgi:hypothetical protein